MGADCSRPNGKLCSRTYSPVRVELHFRLPFGDTSHAERQSKNSSPVDYCASTDISPISPHPVASTVWLMILGVDTSACGSSFIAFLK